MPHLPRPTVHVVLDGHCPLVAKAAVGKVIRRYVESPGDLAGGPQGTPQEPKARRGSNLLGAAGHAVSAAMHWGHAGGKKKGGAHGSNKKKSQKKHTAANARAAHRQEEQDAAAWEEKEEDEDELEVAAGEVKVPLKSVLPPYRSLTGHLVVGVSLAADEWDKTWEGLEGRDVTVTIKVAGLDA